MYGPEPRGHWSAVSKGAFEHLPPSARYEVARPFTDFDGAIHDQGECWVYLGHSYFPHDDGLSLFVSLDGDSEWHVRLQWRPEAQGPIIDRLEDDIRAAQGGSASHP